MKITKEEVSYVADLANLRLSEGELARMQKDMDEILTHIEKLNELDTTEVEPMAQVLYEQPGTTVLREDREHVSLSSEVALSNAPSPGAGYFKVPKVIER